MALPGGASHLASYQGPHEPLIDLELFDRAQQILAERSDDNSQRTAMRTGRCGFPWPLSRCHEKRIAG